MLPTLDDGTLLQNAMHMFSYGTQNSSRSVFYRFSLSEDFTLENHIMMIYIIILKQPMLPIFPFSVNATCDLSIRTWNTVIRPGGI